MINKYVKVGLGDVVSYNPRIFIHRADFGMARGHCNAKSVPGSEKK